MQFYTNQYKEILKPERRISKSLILPRNIYRISTYVDGIPPTKVGIESRYVFVIGKIDKKIHCLLLNHVLPASFISFLNKLRDKTKPIEKDQPLSELLKLTGKDGHQLFETYVKRNRAIYSHKLDNYRSYFLDKIQNVWEIRFEDGFLQEIFKEGNTADTRKEVIKKEINEKDG
jgi:hypothetical protein